MLPIVADTLPCVNKKCYQLEARTDTVSSMNAKTERGIRIGQRIRAIRESRDRMSMKELAAEAGTTPGYIRAIEVGAKEVTSLDLADRIAHALGVSREELLGDDTQSDERRRLREQREKFEVATRHIAELSVSIPGKSTTVAELISDPGYDIVAHEMAGMPADERIQLIQKLLDSLTPEQREKALEKG